MNNLRRSDAPPSLAAANQAQIDDLVRRNHTLEYTNKKLSEQVAAEVARSKEAVLEIQKQWHENERLWREECDDLLACYRYAQLRMVSDVETERVNVLNEQMALRREKLLRLQRDYRITLFHAKERELEERILELEEENGQMVIERKELSVLLKKRHTELVAQLQLNHDEIRDLMVERDEVERDVGKLREENAHLQASLDSASSRLERTHLQLEGAQTARSELESLNDDLKRKNHDIQRQLDKWQRLENRGDAELDALRKRKIELDVEVQELRDRLEKASEETSRSLEKEKKRVDRMKDTTLEWQETAKKHQQEAKDVKKELVKLQKELEQVQAQQGQDVAPSSKPAKPSARAKKLNTPEGTEAESKRKNTSRHDKEVTSRSEANEVHLKTAKKQRKMSPVTEEEEDIEQVKSPPTLGSKTAKGKAKERAREESVEVLDDEVSRKAQRKRKTAGDDSASEKAKRSRVPEVSKRVPSTITQDVGDGEDQEDGEAPRKKKRKINLFSTRQPGSFDFGVGLNSGLGIPTTLSPVKEAEGPVPSRAIPGSVMSGIVGGLIRNRMASRT